MSQQPSPQASFDEGMSARRAQAYDEARQHYTIALGALGANPATEEERMLQARIRSEYGLAGVEEVVHTLDDEERKAAALPEAKKVVLAEALGWLATASDDALEIAAIQPSSEPASVRTHRAQQAYAADVVLNMARAGSFAQAYGVEIGQSTQADYVLADELATAGEDDVTRTFAAGYALRHAVAFSPESVETARRNLYLALGWSLLNGETGHEDLIGVAETYDAIKDADAARAAITLKP